MQQRLNCASRYLSWNMQHGRALDAMLCALRKQMYGPENIWPTMDWETCTLHCGHFKDLDTDQLLSDPPQLSVSNYEQRLAKLLLKSLQGNTTDASGGANSTSL